MMSFEKTADNPPATAISAASKPRRDNAKPPTRRVTSV